MKALTLLPKSIKEKYGISRDSDCININHSKYYISIDFDERFRIETNGVTYSIYNSKVCVSLWINADYMHTTVF